jgi:hypothetical protein
MPPLSALELRAVQDAVTYAEGYILGAGGALPGPASALSSLPLCPCERMAPPGYAARPGRWTSWTAHRDAEAVDPCLEPARRVQGTTDRLRCLAGHEYRGVALELVDAAGAEAAARRRGLR